jgi:hypothetical protein
VKIRMLEARTGPRWDDRAWPGYGGEIDVSDEEGAGLCAQGAAVPVAQRDADVETRAAESAAEAPEPDAPAKPAVNDPKDAWVAHAATQGLPEAEAAGLTKADLIDRYGG